MTRADAEHNEKVLLQFDSASVLAHVDFFGFSHLGMNVFLTFPLVMDTMMNLYFLPCNMFSFYLHELKLLLNIETNHYCTFKLFVHSLH